MSDRVARFELYLYFVYFKLYLYFIYFKLYLYFVYFKRYVYFVYFKLYIYFEWSPTVSLKNATPRLHCMYLIFSRCVSLRGSGLTKAPIMGRKIEAVATLDVTSVNVHKTRDRIKTRQN